LPGRSAPKLTVKSIVSLVICLQIWLFLPSIEVPALVIHGDNDQYGSTDQVKSIACKTSGHVQVEIVKNCAHVPHVEAQSVVLRLMSDFIAQVTQGR
jgi:pimeloyl-ACP methyl ester carboxylesterase